MTAFGKYGEFKPTETIDGGVIKSHYHKKGLGDGYYTIIPTKAPENLPQLIADLDKHIKSHKRKSKAESASPGPKEVEGDSDGS